MDGILHEGDSAFAVSEDRDSLELRIDETLRAAYGKAEKTGASKTQTVADHLRTAFSEAYGLKPGPSAAYAHAVTAVEGLHAGFCNNLEPKGLLRRWIVCQTCLGCSEHGDDSAADDRLLRSAENGDFLGRGPGLRA
ncbi:hypothetical protein GCM10010289_01580 [Streptomyces violascens]|nr:hypothetical protein GCM10010289_01580 [Streptomyces violascens]